MDEEAAQALAGGLGNGFGPEVSQWMKCALVKVLVDVDRAFINRDRLVLDWLIIAVGGSRRFVFITRRRCVFISYWVFSGYRISFRRDILSRHQAVSRRCALTRCRIRSGRHPSPPGEDNENRNPSQMPRISRIEHGWPGEPRQRDNRRTPMM